MSFDTPQPLTLDRVITTMSGFGVALHMVPEVEGVAGANLNGHDVTVATLGQQLIIRVDTPTDELTSVGDPSWFVAANKFNTISFHATAAIVDRTEQLVSRVEVENDCQAGVTDDQLRYFLKSGIDTVLTAVVAMAHIHDGIIADNSPAGL